MCIRDRVEAILFVADASRGIGPKDAALLGRLKEAKAPVVAAINKADPVSYTHLLQPAYHIKYGGFYYAEK